MNLWKTTTGKNKEEQQVGAAAAGSGQSSSDDGWLIGEGQVIDRSIPQPTMRTDDDIHGEDEMLLFSPTNNSNTDTYIIEDGIGSNGYASASSSSSTAPLSFRRNQQQQKEDI